MRDLPRKLDATALADLFQADTRLVEALAGREDPLGIAREVLAALPEDARVEALNAHPRIGERRLEGRSAEEQGAGEDDADVLAELDRLNAEYEKRFGFRFVVFVDRRPRAALLPILRERLERARAEELERGCDELVAIALDRWRRS